MKQAAYIVSYFGKDRGSVLHSKRLEYHRRQLEWLCTEEAIDKIFIYSQSYEEDDFCLYQGKGHEKVTFIESETPQHPGIGRNILLAEFYASDYDWAHFIDNDSILYDHMFGKNVFKFLEEANDDPQMRFVAGFRPIIPRHEAFSAEYHADMDTRDDAFVFTRDSHLKGSFFSIRNFAKYDNIEIYMDEKMFQMEDDEFALAMIANGLAFYKCHNIVLNEMANSDYSVLFSDQDRMVEVAKWKSYIADKYSEHGVKLNRKGNVDRKTMLSRCKLAKKAVIPIAGSVGMSEWFDK